MHLKSLEGCRLAIGSYPHFLYNANRGGGVAEWCRSKNEKILLVNFSSETFSIPPLTWRNTKLLGIPIPPGLKIEMHMDKLDGTVNQNSGEILLDFAARFVFSIGYIFSFPNLLVKTSLTTGEVNSRLYKEKGSNLNKHGELKLVGIALIPKTGNHLLDSFLGLPNEALAVLKCELS